MKKLDSIFSKGSQSLEYTEYIEHNGDKLRIFIDKDSHESQSSAVISIWANKKWSKVANIHYSRMSVCKNKVYHNIEVKNGHLYDAAIRYFDEDIKELKRLAKIILN